MAHWLVSGLCKADLGQTSDLSALTLSSSDKTEAISAAVSQFQSMHLMLCMQQNHFAFRHDLTGTFSRIQEENLERIKGDLDYDSVEAAAAAASTGALILIITA
jgi:hypothetical protein